MAILFNQLALHFGGNKYKLWHTIDSTLFWGTIGQWKNESDNGKSQNQFTLIRKKEIKFSNFYVLSFADFHTPVDFLYF